MSSEAQADEAKTNAQRAPPGHGARKEPYRIDPIRRYDWGGAYLGRLTTVGSSLVPSWELVSRSVQVMLISQPAHFTLTCMQAFACEEQRRVFCPEILLLVVAKLRLYIMI